MLNTQHYFLMSGTSWNVCKAYKFTYLACIYGKSNNGAPWGLSAVSTVNKTLNLKKINKKGKKIFGVTHKSHLHVKVFL